MSIFITLALCVLVLCSANHIRAWLQQTWNHVWNAIRGKFSLLGIKES